MLSAECLVLSAEHSSTQHSSTNEEWYQVRVVRRLAGSFEGKAQCGVWVPDTTANAHGGIEREKEPESVVRVIARAAAGCGASTAIALAARKGRETGRRACFRVVQ